MPNDADFQALEKRVAELTQRIHRLEQLLAPPPAKAAPPAVSSPKITVPSTLPPYAPPTFGVPPAIQPPAPPRNLESVIGSQWLNRIGILAIMIGVAYFLKLAFDNNWIGPSGRVAIGLVAGIGIVAWSSRFFRSGYKYFSWSLTSLGIGIMYLSLWAAFQLYQLVPAPVAFVAMIIVTACAATLALRQDAQVLAAVAIAGGFSTPALLSTGQNRPITLFSYIALLNLFGIALVAMRPWRRLLLGCFAGTIIFYAGWFGRFETDAQSTLAAGFATLFFLQFAFLPLIKRLHAGKDQQWHTSKSFITVALLNPVVYFVELFAIYSPAHREDLSWAAIVLGAFYIFLSKNLTADSAADNEGTGIGPLHRWLHLAIAVTFLTVAIPLRLHSHWVTMAWFVEAGVLLWTGERARDIFLKRAAVAALALGVARMLFIDDFHAETLFFNSRFATYALAIAVLIAITLQVVKEKGKDHRAVVIATICINVLALLALGAEVSDFYARRIAQPGNGDNYQDLQVARDFTYSALGMIYGAGLMLAGFWRSSQVLRWQALFLVAATIAKVFSTTSVRSADRCAC